MPEIESDELELMGSNIATPPSKAAVTANGDPFTKKPLISSDIQIDWKTFRHYCSTLTCCCQTFSAGHWKAEQVKGRKSSPPGGRLSVAPTRHWDTCNSNPGEGGIFSLSLILFCYTLFVS